MKHLRLKSAVMSAVMLLSAFAVMPKQANADVAYKLSGTAHVQDYGDVAGSWDANTGILTLGTRGQSKRVEAITVNLENNTGIEGSIRYKVHVQNIGWQDWKTNGQKAGTSGQSLRLEGMKIELTGDLANEYFVEYRVHIQDYGDNQGWVHDGALAGTTGESKRLEEVQIRLVKVGTGDSMSVNYRVHVQDKGWETTWRKDGASSGTTGSSKRLEGIEIHLTGNEYKGGIKYCTHVQNVGWQDYVTNGDMSGTQGRSLRLEGIKIALTGQIANHYDVYYRVHAQDYGWLGWAKNGGFSGTSGLSKRLEAIQIVLVEKGGAAPGNIGGVVSNKTAAYVTADGAAEKAVKSVTTYELNSDGTRGNKTRYVEYDAQGKVVKVAHYYKGSESYTKTYTYDSTGRLTEWTCEEESEFGLNFTTRLTYDSNGKLIKSTQYYTDDTDAEGIVRDEFAYSGNIITLTMYGNTVDTWTFDVETAGELFYDFMYYGALPDFIPLLDGTERLSNYIVKGDADYVVYSSVVSPNAIVTGAYDVYDEHGSKFIRTYDGDCRLVKEEDYSYIYDNGDYSSQPTSIYEYTYDDYGFLTSEKNYKSSTGTTTTTNYENVYTWH